MAEPLLPDDTADWTDEQWIAWLESGDPVGGADTAGVDRPVLPAWRRGPVAMQFLALSMKAVGEVIYGRKEEPAIVIQAAGDPPGDDGLDVQLDFEHPENSVVVVREWLLHQGDGEIEEIVEHTAGREP